MLHFSRGNIPLLRLSSAGNEVSGMSGSGTSSAVKRLGEKEPHLYLSPPFYIFAVWWGLQAGECHSHIAVFGESCSDWSNPKCCLAKRTLESPGSRSSYGPAPSDAAVPGFCETRGRWDPEVPEAQEKHASLGSSSSVSSSSSCDVPRAWDVFLPFPWAGAPPTLGDPRAGQPVPGDAAQRRSSARWWVVGAQPPPHAAYSKDTTFISRSYFKVGVVFLGDKADRVNPVHLPPASNSSAPAYTAALLWSATNATATLIRKNNLLSRFCWAVAGCVSDKAADDAAADRLAKAASGFLSPCVLSRMELQDLCFQKQERILSVHC